MIIKYFQYIFPTEHRPNSLHFMRQAQLCPPSPQRGPSWIPPVRTRLDEERSEKHLSHVSVRQRWFSLSNLIHNQTSQFKAAAGGGATFKQPKKRSCKRRWWGGRFWALHVRKFHSYTTRREEVKTGLSSSSGGGSCFHFANDHSRACSAFCFQLDCGEDHKRK